MNIFSALGKALHVLADGAVSAVSAAVRTCRSMTSRRPTPDIPAVQPQPAVDDTTAITEAASVSSEKTNPPEENLLARTRRAIRITAASIRAIAAAVRRTVTVMCHAARFALGFVVSAAQFVALVVRTAADMVLPLTAVAAVGLFIFCIFGGGMSGIIAAAFLLAVSWSLSEL